MTEIIAAFVTGLTAGGLSCMAVQGGLLAGSLANKIEENIRQGLPRNHKLLSPITIFLSSKIFAYTIWVSVWVGWEDYYNLHPLQGRSCKSPLVSSWSAMPYDC